MGACPSPNDRERASVFPPPDAPLVHYIIIRDDLPKGVQIAQTAHAAGESAGGPLADGTIVVALAVPTEAALLALAAVFKTHDLGYKLIVENDGMYAQQAMAIGLTPTVNRTSIRKVTRHLPLIR